MKDILVIDSISHGTQRGVSRYYHHILDGLISEFGDQLTIYSSEKRAYDTARHVQAPVLPVFRGSHRIGLYGIVQMIRQHRIEKLVKQCQPAVIYSPYYAISHGNASHNFTVYDMIYEKFPEHFKHPADQGFVKKKRRCLETGNSIMAISYSTARDIVEIYPNISRDKIHVTALGVSEMFFSPEIVPITLSRRPYLLYVGHRSGYKNFIRLLEAYGQSELPATHDLRVVSPVGRGFSDVEQKLIERYGLIGCTHLTVAVSEEDLRKAYASAAVFIYPSEYEGFGLPVLEAMASGTLVACSNTSSMPEVGGDFAYYFDPRQTASIAHALHHAIKLPIEERSRRIQDSVGWARQFTWAACQRKTNEIFNALLKASN